MGKLPFTFIFCTYVGLCFSQFQVVNGQETASAFISEGKAATAIRTTVRPLNIGDQVPDIEFNNVLNYKTKKARLSDFKGKLVILDMWSIWCTSCISGFPKMESLQNKFNGRIQILLANPHDSKYDNAEKIKFTLNRFKERTGFFPSLPIPINDSILNVYFPHQSVPHQVWINESGKVVAITRSKDVTSENISAILEGKVVSIPVKNDWAFDRNKPLLIDGNGGEADKLVFRSLFARYNAEIGFSSGVRKNDNNEVIGFYMLNMPLRQLVFEAYVDSLADVSPARILWEVRNADQFEIEPSKNHVYSYDLTIPPTPVETFDSRKYLQEDLRRYFNISVSKSKRNLSCLIVTENAAIAGAFTKHKMANAELEKNSIRKYFHNYSIKDVMRTLEPWFGEPIIVNTKIARNIDIDFPDNFDFSNSDALLKLLSKTGFTIRREERSVDVIVVTD